jgi:putative hemolysin
MQLEALTRVITPVSSPASAAARFSVQLATRSSLIDAALRLRYKVFCEEMGADIDRHDGRDVDEFDALCEHLVVIDEWRDKVVGTYRILPPWSARRLGKRYSEGEFRIDALRAIDRDLFEVGRACVHPAYRTGEGAVVLARLWTGLGAYVRENQVKYLAGCASVPLERGTLNLGAMRSQLLRHHAAPEEFRIEPLRGLPSMGDPCGATPMVPPLLKGYLRLGAWVGGEPAWDPTFDCADFFVLLAVGEISPRYARHFLGYEMNH